jgi:MFS family permease
LPDSVAEISEEAQDEADALLTPEEAEAKYDKFVWDNLPRNFVAHFLHGMLGMTGFRLFNAPTFLPAYLHMLSGSDFIVGLGQSLQMVGGVVSPIVGAAHIEHRKRVLPVSMLMGTLMRLPMLGIALAGWFLKGQTQALLVSTMLFLFLMGIFSGAQGVAFQMLMAKVIPIARRGRLQAYRNIVGGAVAAGLSWAAGKWLIGSNALGNGYATTFFLAVVLTSVGLSLLAVLMREPEPPTVRERARIIDRIRDFPGLIASDRSFGFFMLAQLCSSAGRIAAPFYILSAGHVIPLTGGALANMSLAFLGADTLTNMIWGVSGDRFGFRSTFIASLGLWIAATAVLIATPILPGVGPFGAHFWIFVAFFGLGSAQSGQMMSSSTMVLEFGTREDMAMRLAFTQTAQGLTSALGPLLGGLIAGVLGYNVLFGVSMGFLMMGLMILIFLVQEPRGRRERA